MTDNTNDIIHNITIEYLINKQYHNFFKKDGDLLISINKRDKKFYKKRILNVTRDLFLNDDVNISPDVKNSYNNYIKHCIEYFKMLDKSDIIQNDYNENVKTISDNEDADKLILENHNEYDENNVDSNNTTKNKNQYDNANSMLFNKHNKNNTLDNFVKKIHIEKNKIPEIIPRKRRINLKDPLLKIKGVNNGVNNNINNNYEKNNEKNPQECN
jgi:hypothetical protein